MPVSSLRTMHETWRNGLANDSNHIRKTVTMALDIKIEETKGIDILEHGRAADGRPLSFDRRMFMQLHLFTDCKDSSHVVSALEESGLAGVLYQNLADPYGIGLLTFDADPSHFTDSVRPVLSQAPFCDLTARTDETLTGRSYAIGYEQDLEDVLLKRPVRHVCNTDWPWAVWYPLRRSGKFEQLGAKEQRAVLMEHGGIGVAYGRLDYAHDVRLACHGLDKHDNDFVIALVGKDLHPLSAVVQHMRKTRQTSQYLDRMGPFFVGKAVWQNAGGHPV